MTHYSIIIPHKNSPELLTRCVHSIPQRDDIEIIVVDDHSDADKLPTLDARDGLNVILTTAGKGAGYARNVALQQAHGEWLLFADADDYFLPDAFAIFDKHLNSKSDIIYFTSQSVFSDTLEPANRQMTVLPLLLNYNKDDKDSEYRLRFGYNEPWGKMIRHEMVKTHHITFDEVRWANDFMFSTKIGYYADSITVDLSPVYCITIAYGSLIHQRSIDSRKCRYEVTLRNNQFLREHGFGQYQHSIMYSLRIAASYGPKVLWDFIKLGKRYDADFLMGAKQWIPNAFKSIFHNEDANRKKYIVKS